MKTYTLIFVLVISSSLSAAHTKVLKRSSSFTNFNKAVPVDALQQRRHSIGSLPLTAAPLTYADFLTGLEKIRQASPLPSYDAWLAAQPLPPAPPGRTIPTSIKMTVPTVAAAAIIMNRQRIGERMPAIIPGIIAGKWVLGGIAGCLAAWWLERKISSFVHHECRQKQADDRKRIADYEKAMNAKLTEQEEAIKKYCINFEKLFKDSQNKHHTDVANDMKKQREVLEAELKKAKAAQHKYQAALQQEIHLQQATLNQEIKQVKNDHQEHRDAVTKEVAALAKTVKKAVKDTVKAQKMAAELMAAHKTFQETLQQQAHTLENVLANATERQAAAKELIAAAQHLGKGYGKDFPAMVAKIKALEVAVLKLAPLVQKIAHPQAGPTSPKAPAEAKEAPKAPTMAPQAAAPTQAGAPAPAKKKRGFFKTLFLGPKKEPVAPMPLGIGLNPDQQRAQQHEEVKAQAAPMADIAKLDQRLAEIQALQDSMPAFDLAKLEETGPTFHDNSESSSDDESDDRKDGESKGDGKKA